jgi:hypothetical protein
MNKKCFRNRYTLITPMGLITACALLNRVDSLQSTL